VYYVARTWHVPDHVALIAGDVLHNLRSALDYLVYALIRANGKTPSTSAGFPIFDHEPVSQKEKNWFDEKIKDIPDTAQDVIRFLKPYKAGMTGYGACTNWTSSTNIGCDSPSPQRSGNSM